MHVDNDEEDFPILAGIVLYLSYSNNNKNTSCGCDVYALKFIRVRNITICLCQYIKPFKYEF